MIQYLIAEIYYPEGSKRRKRFGYPIFQENLQIGKWVDNEVLHRSALQVRNCDNAPSGKIVFTSHSLDELANALILNGPVAGESQEALVELAGTFNNAADWLTRSDQHELRSVYYEWST
jgi:hypothetical protein